MAMWEHLGVIANVAQLTVTGVDAGSLITMIIQAANTARMHKKNCRQFAKHVKLIGNLLEPLRISELKRHPGTREPLEQLEDALRRSYVLVNSCRNRSYLYLIANGWNIVQQFREAQNEIDNCLKLIPLITLVDNSRIKERLEYIERDQCEYTWDVEDRQVQNDSESLGYNAGFRGYDDQDAYNETGAGVYKYTYTGGKLEGSSGNGFAPLFDDYGRLIMAPRVEEQQQDDGVKLLSQGFGQEDMDVLCQEEMEMNSKSSTGLAVTSNGSWKLVACPTCTVHLQVPAATGSETIECGVCQYPFRVSND